MLLFSCLYLSVVPEDSSEYYRRSCKLLSKQTLIYFCFAWVIMILVISKQKIRDVIDNGTKKMERIKNNNPDVAKKRLDIAIDTLLELNELT